MPLNFPNTPVANETYTYSGVTYVFDGQKWTSRGPVSGLPLLPDENGNVVIAGNLVINGGIESSGNLTVTGNIEGSGNLTVTGDINNA